MLQVTYFILCIFRFTLPLSQFFPFLVEHGLNLELFIINTPNYFTAVKDMN
jgi:uncharacterized membrane protein (DUF441 family)